MQNTVGLLTWLRRGAFPCMGTVAYFPRVWCKRYSSGYCPGISPGSLSLPRDHRIRGHINFVYMDLFIWILVWSCTRIFATPPPSRCRIVVHDVPLGRKGRRDG